MASRHAGLLSRQLAAELPNRHLICFGERYKLQTMLQAELVANDGHHM